MAKKTVITAEPGKQELFITRELKPASLFSVHIPRPIFTKNVVGPDEFADRRKDGCRTEAVSLSARTRRPRLCISTRPSRRPSPERIIGTFEFDGLPGKGIRHNEQQNLRTSSRPPLCLVHQSKKSGRLQTGGMIASVWNAALRRVMTNSTLTGTTFLAKSSTARSGYESESGQC